MAVLNAKQRAKSAVVKVKGAPASGQKFPIPDKGHAQAAVARENQAKPPLTAAQKADLHRREAQFGVGPKAKTAKKGK